MTRGGARTGLLVRPMGPEDVEAAYAATRAAFPGDRERLEQAPLRTPEEAERYKARYRHLLKTDPDGAFVAVDGGGRAAGVALSLRREGLWFLSLMAVDPAHRGKGVGRALLDRASSYAEGCRGGMIPASGHPAAIRRYALAGFDLRPSLRAGGMVRRGALPKGLAVRDGDGADLKLASSVDRAVRGSAHGPDIGALLRAGGRLLVAERPAGGRSGPRGYAVVSEGSPWLLAATDPAVAAELLWACLAGARTGAEVDVRWLTASQRWAVPVALAAGLSLAPFGPLCVRGELGPLAPYLPSMLYL